MIMEIAILLMPKSWKVIKEFTQEIIKRNCDITTMYGNQFECKYRFDMIAGASTVPDKKWLLMAYEKHNIPKHVQNVTKN